MIANKPAPPAGYHPHHHTAPLLRASAVSLALACLFSSCSPKNPPPEPTAVYAPEWLGTISMVNFQENFALIETTSPVPPGTTIQAMRDLETSATLRTTPLKNHPFIIADIITGTPAPKDRITLTNNATSRNAGNSSNAPQDR